MSQTADGASGLRDLIRRLEDIKDRIIELIGSRTVPDETTRAQWIGDAKETYYTIVMVSDLLRPGAGTPADLCRSLLEVARRRAQQTPGELNAYPDGDAAALTAAFRDAFDACYRAIALEVERSERG